MRVYILLGPQGSGKGEQAKKLIEKFNLAYLSPGAILREIAKVDSDLGRQIDQTMNKEGKLIPDDLTNQVVSETLDKMDWKEGFLFDGYPRRVSQYEYLKKYLEEKDEKIDGVILLNIADETSLKRISSRRICDKCKAVYNLVTNPSKVEGKCDLCDGNLIQRSDDETEVVKKRLNEYHEETEPIVEEAKKDQVLIEINGELPISEVFNQILVNIE